MFPLKNASISGEKRTEKESELTIKEKEQDGHKMDKIERFKKAPRKRHGIKQELMHWHQDCKINSKVDREVCVCACVCKWERERKLEVYWSLCQ